MDSFTSMKSKLEATGLYSVVPGTNIYAELKAYAAGLDVLFETLDVMLRELFIDTAETWGIDNRELLLGRIKDDCTLEKRREMLKIYEQMMGGKCTLEAFNMVLKGYGLNNFEIAELPIRNRVTINVNESVSDEQKSVIEERIAADFPSHLYVAVTYPAT